MGSSRVIALGLWVPSMVALAVLAAWTFLDALRVTEARAVQAIAAVEGIGLILLSFGLRYVVPTLRRGGLILLLAAYFGAHTLWLPLDATPAVGFLVLALAHIELRIVAERFAPLYLRDLGTEDRVRLQGSLARSALRVGGTAAMAFLLPIFAGDLALAGTLPANTIPTALILAAALVLVLVILAILPSLENRRR